MFVPVETKDGQRLMPMHAARARKLVERGEATPYFNNGIFCIRLNKEPSDRETQDIAVGVDPGSKKEGFTVKSEKHTYLNVQADAHDKEGTYTEKLPRKVVNVHDMAEQDVWVGRKGHWLEVSGGDYVGLVVIKRVRLILHRWKLVNRDLHKNLRLFIY